MDRRAFASPKGLRPRRRVTALPRRPGDDGGGGLEPRHALIGGGLCGGRRVLACPFGSIAKRARPPGGDPDPGEVELQSPAQALLTFISPSWPSERSRG